MGKIFGIGLSKTGTKSLTYILQRNKFHVIHNPDVSKLFSGKYEGVTDVPVALNFKKLDEKFPNSKFIYTVRPNVEEWAQSLFKLWKGKNNGVNTNKMRKKIREDMYGVSNPNSPMELYDAYKKHHENVMDYFKDREEDLLVLNIIGGDTPQKVYDFLNIKGKETIFPKLGTGENKLIKGGRL
jgi:hypothetical protein